MADLRRGLWARLWTRAQEWLLRGWSSTATFKGSRTGFWSSSSLTPTGTQRPSGTEWATSHQSSIRRQYQECYRGEILCNIKFQKSKTKITSKNHWCIIKTARGVTLKCYVGSLANICALWIGSSVILEMEKNSLKNTDTPATLQWWWTHAVGFTFSTSGSSIFG